MQDMTAWTAGPVVGSCEYNNEPSYFMKGSCVSSINIVPDYSLDERDSVSSKGKEEFFL
jgi:hypothetical protein